MTRAGMRLPVFAVVRRTRSFPALFCDQAQPLLTHVFRCCRVLEPQAVGASKNHDFSLRYALLASASQSTHNPSLTITVLSGTIESRGGRAQRIAGLVALQSGVFCRLRK